MTDILLNARERAEYRLAATLLDIAENRKPSGLAFEVSEELAKHFPANAKRHGGLLVPHSITHYERAGLDTATATKGPELKFVGPKAFIEALRARSVVIGGGATVIDRLQGDIQPPQETAPATASWTAQNPLADVADTSLTLGSIALSPKELIATTSESRQLMAQSYAQADVDDIILTDLAAIHALAIDAAALNGSGAAGQPTGILSRAGTNANPFGANGALPTWALITAFERITAVANGDGDRPNQCYITTPEVRDRLRITDRQATSGWFIMDGQNGINEYPVLVTNALPKNLVKGTSGAVCHPIIFGAMSEFILGFWGMFEVIADPFKLKKQGMVELTTYQLADVNARHAASFTVSKDVLP